jgi:hypothetical protein
MQATAASAWLCDLRARQQLESLLAAEGVDVDTEEGAARRVALATEVALHWRHAIEPQELPLHVQHLFE